MTTYKSIKQTTIVVDETTFQVEIFAVYEKFANVPYYECYIDGKKTVCRWSRIQKRDILNYIERYL